MRQTAICLFLIVIFALATACSENAKPKTKDPLEALTYDYLNLIKQKKWDEAYAIHAAETRKYFPEKEFIAYAEDFISPKVDAIYVTRIEKRKLDATVETAFKPKSNWATYNSLESAKLKLEYVYQDGKWWISRPEIVVKGAEEEAKNNARQERVNKWKPHLKFSDFRVENKITDEGPTLVFHGELENTTQEPLEMAMVKVDFFDGKGSKVFHIVFVPIYVSEWQKKEALKPGEKRTFMESVSSEIPDDWSGKIDYYLFDAGEMPNKR